VGRCNDGFSHLWGETVPLDLQAYGYSQIVIIIIIIIIIIFIVFICS